MTLSGSLLRLDTGSCKSEILTEEWRVKGGHTLLMQGMPADLPDWSVVATPAVCAREGELLGCNGAPLVVAVTCRQMAGSQCMHDQLNVPNTKWLTFCFLAAGLASSLEALTRLFLLITKPLRVPWGAIILHQGANPHEGTTPQARIEGQIFAVKCNLLA